MIVTTQSNGREVTGLRVSERSAQRYFSKRAGAVELQLGDLQIQCKLPPDFWQGQPEIHDPRLCEWLKYKVFQEPTNRKPITLAMVQSGKNSFSLQSMSLANSSAARRGSRYSSAA